MSQPPYGTQPPYGSQPPYGGQPPSGSQPPYGGQPPHGGQPPAGQPPYGGQPAQGGAEPGWGQPPPPVPQPPPAPPSYGPPPATGLPSYQQPTTTFGQPAGGPGFGAPPGGPPYGGGPGSPYGAPQPKKSPVPFIVLGLVVLLIAGGLGLFLALNKDDPTPIATSITAPTTQDTETADTEPPTEDTGSPTDTEPNFPDSGAAATSFLHWMIVGDYETAHSALCEDGRDASDGDGFADGQALADDFFGFLQASSVTSSETTDVYLDPDDPDRDVVEVSLATDVGQVPLVISILEEGGDLTICGYDAP